jgi:hypothetical protein
MEQQYRGPTPFPWTDFSYIWYGVSYNQREIAAKISSSYLFCDEFMAAIDN